MSLASNVVDLWNLKRATKGLSRIAGFLALAVVLVVVVRTVVVTLPRAVRQAWWVARALPGVRVRPVSWRQAVVSPWQAARTLPELAAVLTLATLLAPDWWRTIPAVALCLLVCLPVLSVDWCRAVAQPAELAMIRRTWRRVATACQLGHRARLSGIRSASYAAPDSRPKIVHAAHVNDGRTIRLTLALPAGQIASDISSQHERLASAWRARSVSVTPVKPGMVTVTVTHDQPPRQRAITTAAVPELLHVGTTSDGDPWYVHAFRHTLTAGVTGAGKGSVMWSSVRAIAPYIDSGHLRLHGIDLKGGMELTHAGPLFEHMATTPEQAADLLEAQAKAMTERARKMAGKQRKHEPTETEPAHIIVIDELAMITAYITDKTLRARITAALNILLTQGRAPGWTVWAYLQDPAKDVLDVRQHFPTRIAMRLAEPSQTAMMLGHGTDAACHLIDPDRPGTAYVRTEDGRVQQVRASWVSDDDIHALAKQYGAKPDSEQDVYFVCEDKPDGRIKIGIAKNVRQRLATLQTASSDPLRLMGTIPGGGRKLERQLHRQWAYLQTHGEWFETHPDLLTYINDHAA